MSGRPLMGAALVFLMGAAGIGQAANPAVLLPDGRRVEGTEVRATRDGTIYLTTAAGRVEYPKGTRVVMDEPLDLQRAVDLIQKQQFGEASAVLEKVAADYRFLGWDQKAIRFLAVSHAGNRAWTKAVATYEQLLAEFPEAESDGAVRSGYLEALAEAGEKEKVEPRLAQAIAGGTREEAARAQMIRSAYRMAAGDVEGALYDAIRTFRFFKEFTGLAAEGAFRAGEALDKLGEPDQARAYYDQLVREFPESVYAARAKVKAEAKP